MGDCQRDLHYHRGPDRAVLLYSMELIRALQKEGHPIEAGATSENLTVSGLDCHLVVPGTEIRVSAVRLVVTKYATPCCNVRGLFWMEISRGWHKSSIPAGAASLLGCSHAAGTSWRLS
jgi:MOSC domain-containing protein YiiM